MHSGGYARGRPQQRGAGKDDMSNYYQNKSTGRWYVKPSDTKPRENKQTGPLFPCEECKTTSYGEVHFSKHLAGRRHQTAMRFPQAPITSLLDFSQPVIVGSNYLISCQNKYVCRLCHYSMDGGFMHLLTHVSCLRHRHRYLKVHYPELYNNMLENTNAGHERKSVALDMAMDVEEKEGRPLDLDQDPGNVDDEVFALDEVDADIGKATGADAADPSESADGQSQTENMEVTDVEQKELLIYVKGLPIDYTWEQLWEMFDPDGSSTHMIKITLTPPLPPHNDRIAAYLTMNSVEACEKLISTFNHSCLPGTDLRITMIRTWPEKDPAEKGEHDLNASSVYVSNLPTDVTRQDLQSMFFPHGWVTAVIQTREKGAFLVHMESFEQCTAVLKAFDGKCPPGSNNILKVKFGGTLMSHDNKYFFLSISNLPHGYDKMKLAKMCEPHATEDHIDMINKRIYLSKCGKGESQTAIIMMMSEDACERIVKKYDGECAPGTNQKMHITPSLGEKIVPEVMNTMSDRDIYVSGLEPHTTKEILKNYFSHWGEVSKAVVMLRQGPHKYKSRGFVYKSRGFGYISYKDPASINAALKAAPHAINGKEVFTKRVDPEQPEENSLPEDVANHPHVLIKGLPAGYTSIQLREGLKNTQNQEKLTSLKILPFKPGIYRRSAATVTLETVDACQRFIRHCSGKLLPGMTDPLKLYLLNPGQEKQDMLKPTPPAGVPSTGLRPLMPPPSFPPPMRHPSMGKPFPPGRPSHPHPLPSHPRPPVSGMSGPIGTGLSRPPASGMSGPMSTGLSRPAPYQSGQAWPSRSPSNSMNFGKANMMPNEPGTSAIPQPWPSGSNTNSMSFNRNYRMPNEPLNEPLWNRKPSLHPSVMGGATAAHHTSLGNVSHLLAEDKQIKEMREEQLRLKEQDFEITRKLMLLEEANKKQEQIKEELERQGSGRLKEIEEEQSDALIIAQAKRRADLLEKKLKDKELELKKLTEGQSLSSQMGMIPREDTEMDSSLLSRKRKDGGHGMVGAMSWPEQAKKSKTGSSEMNRPDLQANDPETRLLIQAITDEMKRLGIKNSKVMLQIMDFIADMPQDCLQVLVDLPSSALQSFCVVDPAELREKSKDIPQLGRLLRNIDLDHLIVLLRAASADGFHSLVSQFSQNRGLLLHMRDMFKLLDV